METAIAFINDYLQAGLNSSWHWFNALSREEWILVLSVACMAGFLCLRGFGSRSTY